MGSKRRIARYLLPIILKDREPWQWYIEPFVGGANMIECVTGPRLGSDLNKYVIEALTAIRDKVNELPKNNMEFTEEDYKKLRLSDDCWFKGYAAFCFSFGSKFLGGWARREGRDYVKEAYNNAVKQSPKLQDLMLVNCSYDKLEPPKSSIIYCDPPYKNTTKYKAGVFDHDKFFEWCRIKTLEGHKVFVSEYAAPGDFKCIWSKELTVIINAKALKPIERLFIFDPVAAEQKRILKDLY